MQTCLLQSTDPLLQGGFELLFMDVPLVGEAVQKAVVSVRSEGCRRELIDFSLYWGESAERA